MKNLSVKIGEKNYNLIGGFNFAKPITLSLGYIGKMFSNVQPNEKFAIVVANSTYFLTLDAESDEIIYNKSDDTNLARFFDGQKIFNVTKKGVELILFRRNNAAYLKNRLVYVA